MKTKKIVLSREQISKASSVDGLQITAGKSGKFDWLAPTWNMVRAYKDGTMSIPEYLKRYRIRLQQGTVEQVRELYKLGVRNGGSITFRCYCADPREGKEVFCHTYGALWWLHNHPEYSKGFEIHPSLIEYIEGLEYIKEWAKTGLY